MLGLRTGIGLRDDRVEARPRLNDWSSADARPRLSVRPLGTESQVASGEIRKNGPVQRDGTVCEYADVVGGRDVRTDGRTDADLSCLRAFLSVVQTDGHLGFSAMDAVGTRSDSTERWKAEHYDNPINPHNCLANFTRDLICWVKKSRLLIWESVSRPFSPHYTQSVDSSELQPLGGASCRLPRGSNGASFSDWLTAPLPLVSRVDNRF
jgi:hypothetical protein